MAKKKSSKSSNSRKKKSLGAKKKMREMANFFLGWLQSIAKYLKSYSCNQLYLICLNWSFISLLILVKY